MILLDTDHLSLLQVREAPAAYALQTRLESFPLDEVATTVITLEEQMRGWLARLHAVPDVAHQVAYYERLLGVVTFFAAWIILPFDTPAAAWFTQLGQQCIRIGTLDLKIAAIALAHDALLLSSNLRDFRQVPGLQVEDWHHLAP